MTDESAILFKGSPGSPYTRKMQALLRYRHIPYRMLISGFDTEFDLPEPKVAIIPVFYLENSEGELEAVVDSTPIIRRFEREFPFSRAVIPDDPVVAFISALLEDYGDEWLTKAMFHYRWYYEADIQTAGNMLPRWSMLNASEDKIQQRRDYIIDRQIGRLYVVGSNKRTAPVIEASYRRFLEIMDKHLQQYTFLLGERPSSADFAFYGQLTQLAQFDPTPRQLTLENAPRVYAWVDIMSDLSGNPGDAEWLESEQLSTLLRPLLKEIGRTYVPVMLANAKAMNDGNELVEATVEGEHWQQTAFPYQARCVAELRNEFARLASHEREKVLEVLEGTGCELMFAKNV